LGIIQPPNLSLVTEFCEGGDLLSYIRKQDPDPQLRITWISDIAVGMLHLHNENIIHRDLAARNILLTGALRAKVTDFGFSRQTESSDQQSKTSSDVGPLKWMAPEALTNRTYSNKSDVYSFAITVWEIITGEDPYEGENVVNVAIEVSSKGLRPPIPDADIKITKLMTQCWQTSPEDRPDFDTICSYLNDGGESSSSPQDTTTSNKEDISPFSEGEHSTNYTKLTVDNSLVEYIFQKGEYTAYKTEKEENNQRHYGNLLGNNI